MKNLTLVLFVLLGLVGASFADITAISASKAAERLKKKPEVVVIDLRTPKEFASGHIKGAVNINVSDKEFAEKLGKLDRKKIYLMHCRSGGRSSASIPVWNRLGFENVLHLTTGILGWEKAGQKLVVPEKKTTK